VRAALLLLRTCAVLVTLVHAPTGAVAWNQTETSAGKKVRWSTPCHNYYINEEGSHQIVDGSDMEAVKASFKAWTDVDCSALTFQFAGETNFSTTGFGQEESPINLVVFRDKKWPYNERPVAFTAVTYNKDDGLILDADIELNEQDYAFTTTPDKEHFKIDLQNTLTHEVGHVAGLDHSSDSESTMYFKAAPGESSKRTLGPDDIEGLCTLYPEANAKPCAAVKPQYLFIDFPEGKEPGGCSASVGRGGAVFPAGLLLVLALVALAGRRGAQLPRIRSGRQQGDELLFLGARCAAEPRGKRRRSE